MVEPERIASYTLRHQIGSGGMAKVYFAVNSLQDPFAIKVLNLDLATHEAIRKRFRNEMEALKSLRDIEQVCQIRDFLEDGQRMAIVMELLTGVDLLRYIRREGPVAPAQLLAWMRQLLPAFATCHARKIVHRDVKPSNFFLTDTGKLKIMDFGIAKALDQREAQLNSMALGLTGVQEVLGSPMYMSPEQVRGLKEVDHRTDIYSLGVLIHTLLMGRSPYDGLSTRSAFDIQEAILKKPLPELPGELAVFNPLIQRATRKDPADRYQLVPEFLADLDALRLPSQPGLGQPVREEPTTVVTEPRGGIIPVSRVTAPSDPTEISGGRSPEAASTPVAPTKRVSVPAAKPSGDRIPAPAHADRPEENSRPVSPRTSIQTNQPAISAGKRAVGGLVLVLVLGGILAGYFWNASSRAVQNPATTTDSATPPTTETAVLPAAKSTAQLPPDSDGVTPLSWRQATRLLLGLGRIPRARHPAVFAAARRAFARHRTAPDGGPGLDSLYVMCAVRAAEARLAYQKNGDPATRQAALHWYETAYTLRPEPALQEWMKQLKGDVSVKTTPVPKRRKKLKQTFVPDTEVNQ